MEDYPQEDIGYIGPANTSSYQQKGLGTAKISPVANGLRILQETYLRLADTRQQLEGRLVTVLGPDEPMPEEASKMADINPSLANGLVMLARQIDKETTLLRRIIERLEL